MKPATVDFELYRGDDFYYQFVFTNNQDPPIPLNLSEYTFKAEIRDRPEYGKIIYATFDIDTTDASDGIIVLNLSAAATRIPPGYWDLQVSLDGNKKTWIKGAVRPSGDVTQEVSL